MRRRGRIRWLGLMCVVVVTVAVSWAFAGTASASPSVSGVMSRSGDFNGDGYDDIIAFGDGKITVALSVRPLLGQQNFGAPTVWYTGSVDKIPVVADVNYDGLDDVILIQAYSAPIGTVRVLLSHVANFVQSPSWAASLPAGLLIDPSDSRIVAEAGDFNGDHRADLAVFVLAGTQYSGRVRVALSTGYGFTTPTYWNNAMAYTAEAPEVGDFNGDGRDDIALFVRGQDGYVYVYPSTGTSFSGRTMWQNRFSLGDEFPAVGDFNGDGRDDIANFTRGDTADVWVALSTGTSFGPSSLWQGYFCARGEVPGVGDFNGDGRDDVITWSSQSQGSTVGAAFAVSQSNSFGVITVWPNAFPNAVLFAGISYWIYW